MSTHVATEAAPAPPAVPLVEAPPVLGGIDALPRLAAFFLVALGVVGTPLMLLGQFDRLPVLLGTAVGVVALELAWRLGRPSRGSVSRGTAVISLLALLVVAVSTGANARWGSQHLLVDGDPAVYAVTGQLLAETGDLEIDTRKDDVFGGVESLNFAGAGFDASADESTLRPSFLHLLPQALAVASWVGGPQALLWMNAVISGFALLSVFAFGARLLRRPAWALVAMTALALSLPQQHFSRDTFSEVPAQLLVFAGLTLLFDAVARRRGWLPGLCAGLVLGISCVARIDAFFYLVPMVVFATVLVLAGRSAVAGGLVGGLLVGATLGYVDLRVGSPSYLGLQAENLNLIFLALALMTVLCAVALALRGRSLALWERLQGRVLAGSVVALLALLSVYAGVIRPRVETGRNLSPEQPTAVASLQERAGLPVDPLRSYDERSLEWLTWYLGPIAVALGLLGFALLVGRVLLRRRPEDPRVLLAGLAFLLLFGASTALYLWRPSIIPVQYWATRRFLPVTIPGLLLCAAWLATVVRRPTWLRAVVAVVVAASLLVPPLVFLRGHATEREYVPMLAVTEQLCTALELDDAVVLLGGSRIATALPQTISSFCGVPVAVIDSTTTPDQLAEVARSAQEAGKRLVYLSPTAEPVLATGPVPGDFRPVVDVTVSVVALSLLGRPDERFAFPLTIFLAPAGS